MGASLGMSLWERPPHTQDDSAYSTKKFQVLTRRSPMKDDVLAAAVRALHYLDVFLLLSETVARSRFCS